MKPEPELEPEPEPEPEPKSEPKPPSLSLLAEASELESKSTHNIRAKIAPNPLEIRASIYPACKLMSTPPLRAPRTPTPAPPVPPQAATRAEVEQHAYSREAAIRKWEADRETFRRLDLAYPNV